MPVTPTPEVANFAWRTAPARLVYQATYSESTIFQPRSRRGWVGACPMTPELIRFNCPKCGKRCKAPEGAAGKGATCPRCKSHFEIPAPETQPVRTVPVICPGCGRVIQMRADQLAFPSVECAKCLAHFCPAKHVAGQENPRANVISEADSSARPTRQQRQRSPVSMSPLRTTPSSDLEYAREEVRRKNQIVVGVLFVCVGLPVLLLGILFVWRIENRLVGVLGGLGLAAGGITLLVVGRTTLRCVDWKRTFDRGTRNSPVAELSRDDSIPELLLADPETPALLHSPSRVEPATLAEPFVHFWCPGCGFGMTSPVGKVGEKGICPQCGQHVKVPPPRHAKRSNTGSKEPSSLRRDGRPDDKHGAAAQTASKALGFALLLLFASLLAHQPHWNGSPATYDSYVYAVEGKRDLDSQLTKIGLPRSAILFGTLFIVLLGVTSVYVGKSFTLWDSHDTTGRTITVIAAGVMLIAIFGQFL